MIRVFLPVKLNSAYTFPCLFLIALSLSFGCSGSGSDPNRPKTYPVSGTVKHNGKPVDGATVTFQLTEGTGNSVGSTDASGKFTLSTFSPNDGAVAGQYKVSIAKFAPTTAPTNPSTPPPGQIASGDIDTATYAPPPVGGGGATAAAAGPKNLLPAKYANADTSALRALVSDKGENKFDFDLN